MLSIAATMSKTREKSGILFFTAQHDKQDFPQIGADHRAPVSLSAKVVVQKAKRRKGDSNLGKSAIIANPPTKVVLLARTLREFAVSSSHPRETAAVLVQHLAPSAIPLRAIIGTEMLIPIERSVDESSRYPTLLWWPACIPDAIAHPPL